MFSARHPTLSPPAHSDMLALRTIASHVSYRASAVLAAGIHALWQLRNEAESLKAKDSEHTLVAYNGSVMENYPQFREMCQKQLDSLVEGSGGAESGVVELVYAEESSLLGAAVAVACMDG
jgi:hexokinase